MANFPSVTAAGAFESPAVQNAIKTLAEQAVADRLTALEQDTGWRAIAGNAGTSGRILLRRIGRRVTLRLENFLPPAGDYATHVGSLPTGFRYSGQHYFVAWGTTPSIYGMYSGVLLSWTRNLEGAVHARPTAPQSATYTFDTDDAWPTTPPGDPA